MIHDGKKRMVKKSRSDQRRMWKEGEVKDKERKEEEGKEGN